MEIQKSTGIVLSSRQIGEADYSCTIFTKEFGKRDFIVKGIQKSKKRPQIISDPGTTATIIYYFHEDKISYIINEYNIVKHNISIRNDLKKIYLLYFFLALIEKTTGYNDKNKSIYELITAGIDTISRTNFPEHLSVFFMLHLLKLQGILPDFNKCKICNKINYLGFFIDTADFHPVCSKCAGSVKGTTISFNKKTKDYIFQTLNKKFVSIDHSNFDSANLINFLFSLTLFIENYYHVEIKPKSLLLAELSEKSTVKK